MYLLATLLQKLEQWDKDLFVKINSHWTNPFFDTVMPYLRKSIYWAPLYMFILVFVLANYKIKGYWWVVFFLITVSLTDMSGVYLFKYNFHRIRP